MGVIGLSLDDYKALEAKLYGELMKACRRYSNDLSIISVLGILDIVKQEVSELDKTHRKIMKGELSSDNEGSNETEDFDTF